MRFSKPDSHDYVGDDVQDGLRRYLQACREYDATRVVAGIALLAMALVYFAWRWL